jgi:ubiquitin conjugation factor E4 B
MKIRRRRMEKLSGPAKTKTEESPTGETAAPSTSSPLPPSSQSAESSIKPRITVKPAPSPAATADNPFTKLTARPANGNATAVSTSSEATNLKRHFAEDEQSITKPPIKKTSVPSAEEDFESWENRVLGNIFRVTLDPDQKVDGSNHKLIFLKNLRQELEEEQQPIRLSAERLDNAITEACTTVPHNKPVLDYLLPCWKRVLKAMKGFRGYSSARDGILKEAKRLCMSHCIFAVEMPELYRSATILEE